MNSNKKSVLWIYWAILAIGFVLSFGIFPAAIPQCCEDFWLQMTFGISCAGFVMLKIRLRETAGNSGASYAKEVVAGLGTGLLFGTVLYFLPYLLGFFIFYVLYAIWIFLFVSLVYFAVKNRKIHRE